MADGLVQARKGIELLVQLRYRGLQGAWELCLQGTPTASAGCVWRVGRKAGSYHSDLHEGVKHLLRAGQGLAPGSACLGQRLPGAEAEPAQDRPGQQGRKVCVLEGTCKPACGHWQVRNRLLMGAQHQTRLACRCPVVPG